MRRAPTLEPPRVPDELCVEIEFAVAGVAELVGELPGARIVGPRRVAIEVGSARELMGALWASYELAAAAARSWSAILERR